MKTELTEIVYVLDKSGSMEILRDRTINSFNEFLQEQKSVPGEARLTLTFFSSDFKVIHNGAPLNQVEPLTRSKYTPGGMTALYDAICSTIDTVEARIMELQEDEKPARVIYVIHTDGEENSSCEYTREQLVAKISELNDSSTRDFIFLGASLEAIHDAKGFGVSHSMQYEPTDAGTINAFATISKIVTEKRGLPKTNNN